MWRSLFLSSTSLVIACSCHGGGGGPDAFCGPGGAPIDGIVVSGTAFSLDYTHFTAGANNDCPDMPPAPATALTINNHDTGRFFTLCVSHPDQLDTASLAIGTTISATTKVQLVDTNGSTGGCTFVVDRSIPPTGTVTATGACQSGTSHAGFALTVAGTVQLTRTCGATIDSVPATIAGTVAVSAQ